ncbi:hypothetical protein SAG0322_02275 [Streptococcus agalactiae GB00264]|uniref:Uncharacterized protein n=1 Tax=Streptococcus agalactiae CCUG 29376 TaxID=1105255 RepID=A0AAV3JHE9_STRAG|nr:hypothetical protein SAG0104_02450 [Streptococcus agalactiae BSU178]EPU08451.1 hypothetical protein SAG0125_06865 [Streptococcus agalactiae STIR-CD-21]EPU15174.1 hypothetical protein SAG0128_08945 [Streptococcus agalactiae STIR-CD-24]EPU54885.1 hypothetical protein SAG0301_08685 [Streptococcus agalactiae GB00003]EPU81262.1 hypothetical protein SAG0315_04590 [Streptococcus agalactiae GB00202]EPU95480.1 hypothetical protein SAG0322_02275 [Streptococcus agalactiae GB00264]EPV03433.1 hypotheti
MIQFFKNIHFRYLAFDWLSVDDSKDVTYRWYVTIISHFI